MNEAERLSSLRSLRAIGAPPDEATGAAARLAAHLLDCPIALVTLIDEDIQWLRANLGMEHCVSTPRDISFCTHAIELPGHEVMVVEDAANESGPC